jgi:DDE superfamily endonuclease
MQAVPGVARLAVRALREFREGLHGCLTARGDALFELADAVLCVGGPVRSLVQLSLEPEFRRGHGALYDALAAGRVGDQRLFSLLTEVLPPLVDGPEGRARAAEHDVIDRRLPDRALSGVPAEDTARVRDACARWSRLRIAAGATSCPRPDAWCSPGREHVRHGACHCKGSSKTTPGWEYRLAAVTGHLRTAWSAVSPACSGPPPRPGRRRRSRRSRPCCAACPPAGRCRCSSPAPATAPPRSPTAWPGAPPTSWSGCPPGASSTRCCPALKMPT